MYDIVIIGGGVSGMTAAIYGARAGKKVLILEKETPGGQITKSPKIENYPSFKEISGNDLAMSILDQVEALDVEISMFSEVEWMEKKDGFFHLALTNGEDIEGKSVIIASGVTPRNLPVKDADRFVGKGIYYCAICDGPFFEGEEVALVGDGNSALQYAILLSTYCKKVKMFTMTDKLFGEKTLQDAVRNNPKIEIIPNSLVIEVHGEDKLTGVTYTIGNEKKTLETNAVFVAIGQLPTNDRYGDLIDLDEQGYIVTYEDCSVPRTPGLFACGDCRSKKIRQVATAIGDGATAGAEAVNYLNI